MGVILPNLFAVMIAHNGDIDLTLQYNGMGQGYRKPKRILKKTPFQPFRAQALRCRNTYMMCFGTMSFAVTHGSSKMGI